MIGPENVLERKKIINGLYNRLERFLCNSKSTPPGDSLND